LDVVGLNVNYAFKLCFIMTRTVVSQRAVQALVVVIKLDVFEDFTAGLGPAAEELVVWKTLCFQRVALPDSLHRSTPPAEAAA
jgi:hypothetical protein